MRLGFCRLFCLGIFFPLFVNAFDDDALRIGVKRPSRDFIKAARGAQVGACELACVLSKKMRTARPIAIIPYEKKEEETIEQAVEAELPEKKAEPIHVPIEFRQKITEPICKKLGITIYPARIAGMCVFYTVLGVLVLIHNVGRK